MHIRAQLESIPTEAIRTHDMTVVFIGRVGAVDFTITEPRGRHTVVTMVTTRPMSASTRHTGSRQTVLLVGAVATVLQTVTANALLTECHVTHALTVITLVFTL